jgi:phosphoribosylamine-glycine ligase
LKEIVDSESFTTYEKANAYLASHKGEKYRIVSMTNNESPVPLEPLHDYKLIYSSDEGIKETEAGMMPAVKIFEYTK